MNPPPAGRASPPQAHWHGGPQRWTLVLAGDWRAPGADDDAADPQQGTATTLPLPSPLVVGAQACFDGQALAAWGSPLAARLWTLAEALRQRGATVQLDGLPTGLREVVALATPPATGLSITEPAPAHPNRPAGLLTEAAVTAAFLGDVLIALGRWLRGRSALRAADVLQQLDLAGPRSLPIVGLTCGLVGLMLAYMGGAQLGRIGAQNFLADVVTVGMVRELGGLMTGIILAGRVGSAFAAQLATMEAGEEIDALRVLGIDPITHLVLPRLLALALVAPALIAFGALAGVVAGWPAAVGAYGVTSAEYWHQCLRALNGTHLGIGLFKGLLYAALAALAGCREGLHAGRSAQAVGAATTAAVVKALVWIVAAACGTTVLFTSLGY